MLSGPIVCCGELLLDIFNDGQEVPGGAPANVACHLAALRMPVRMVSRVGADERGARLQEWLKESGVEASFVQTDPSERTGIVRVSTGPGGGPAYDIAEPVAWDFLTMGPRELALAQSAGVVVFGTLAQRHPASRAALRQFVECARKAGAVSFLDLNLRTPFFDEETVLWSLRHADVLKLNDHEVRTVSALLGASGDNVELFTGLLREFGIARGVMTSGATGAWVAVEGETAHVPAIPVEVADTVGAGDAFCAVVCAALQSGVDPSASAVPASRAAAFVCSQRGATPAWPEDLVREVRSGLGYSASS